MRAGDEARHFQFFSIRENVNRTIGIRAQGGDSGLSEALQKLGARMSVSIFFACGDDGEPRLDRC